MSGFEFWDFHAISSGFVRRSPTERFEVLRIALCSAELVVVCGPTLSSIHNSIIRQAHYSA